MGSGREEDIDTIIPIAKRMHADARPQRRKSLCCLERFIAVMSVNKGKEEISEQMAGWLARTSHARHEMLAAKRP
jgi:hypothetical protein